MSNNYFQFKHFVINQENCAMKVSTDGVLLGSWANVEDVTSILDIGTGTGLLALMMAQRTLARIDAIEIEPSAFRQAYENSKNSKWSDRIRIINASLQEYVKCGKKYDLIVCNPPYFSNSLKSGNVKRNLARHNDYLSQTELLAGVNKLLSANGRFALILPYNEGKAFILESVTYGLYCSAILNIKPGPEREINRLVIELSRLSQQMEENVVIIRQEDGTYTEDYKRLTSEYYLGTSKK